MPYYILGCPEGHTEKVKWSFARFDQYTERGSGYRCWTCIGRIVDSEALPFMEIITQPVNFTIK